MRKFYTAFVFLFWISMMGLLFQREVLPSFIITSPSGYEIGLTKDTPVRESWMGIYFRDKRIGFSNTVASQDVEGGIAGYRINETVMMRLNMYGERMLVAIKGTSFFSENHILKNFNYRLSSKGYKFDVSGDVKGKDLNLSINANGEKMDKTFRIQQDTLLFNSISPILLFKKMGRAKALDFDIFDPITFATNKVHIKNIGDEKVEVGGIEYDASVFETDISGIKTKTWMGMDGDILKEESLLGFTMYKESPESAQGFLSPLPIDMDLASEFCILPATAIQNARDVSYLKLDKSGELLEVFKDIEPEPSEVLDMPIEYMPDEDFINSNDERIKRLAVEIVGNEENSWDASKKIMRWLYSNIKKTPTLSIPSSLDVLRTMQGDCNEHTVLFTALARSLGIPTKMVAGLVYLEGAFYYHAWPKVYVGKWINMDPTLGQAIADATHIPLLEGGIKEQLELIKIIGDLKIEVLEYR